MAVENHFPSDLAQEIARALELMIKGGRSKGR